MKLSTLLIVFTVILALTACGDAEPVPVNVENVESIDLTENVTPLNVDSLVLGIDEKRVSIEASLKNPTEILTSEMREKIQQKWEKIHFYTQAGVVVRIKAYPYAAISTRTEEFYLENERLMLAVIEDDGTGAKGKSVDEIDKMYYFYQDEVIFERHKSDEAEYGIKDSDAEELREEVAEYLEIYHAKN